MCSDSRGIEWLFEKRESESFGLISKSWKRLWWVSKSHFWVILRLLKSRSWKPRSRSLAKSWIYHSIPLIVVYELVREREKTKKDERKTGERAVPSLSPHAQTPRCFFCMLTSLCPAFPQSGRLEKIVRRFFSSRFFHSYPKQRACSQATWKTKMDSE